MIGMARLGPQVVHVLFKVVWNTMASDPSLDRHYTGGLLHELRQHHSLREFASFIRWIYKYPTMKRPYHVPMSIPGLIILCLVPKGFLIFVMMIGSWVVYAISAGLTAIGVAMYFAMGYCRSRGLLKFIKEELAGTGTEEA
ncbi:putative polyamine transporter [Acorus gramineus]|uniref:Polyamine transporter n=1 Tax=Acorus gramineus TaxID=55184 RepID=A0AAV9BCD6_ACOGR|nr:putative polyamine transporter [Acorus gramineus]